MPAFYHQPETIEDIIDQTVGEVFEYLCPDRRRGGAGSSGGSTRQPYFQSLVETGLIVQVEHVLRNEGIELRSKVLHEPR